MKTINEDFIDVKKAFKEYSKLLEKLSNLLFEYDKCFRVMDNQALRENVLHEKVSDEEKEEIENKIVKLETEIQELVEKLISLENIMATLLEQDQALDEKVVNIINRDHVSAMSEYNHVMARYNRICKDYKDYDFSCIDFFKLENGRKKLNVAIKKYNQKFLSKEDYSLLSVYEATKVAKEEDYENEK